MPPKKYYEAFDERYRQIHSQDLQWFYTTPSAIVTETITNYGITPSSSILEIGCGEGRDALPLLEAGYNLLATDVSTEAVEYCKKKLPCANDRFLVLDCVTDELFGCFDFIYAVAVIHMLVTDDDRNAFYRFIRNHLCQNGVALICTIGDGCSESRTDIRTAFDLKERIHPQSGKTVQIVNTSCRTVNSVSFAHELADNGLFVIEQGMTSVPPDFPQMMYAVVGIG